uniref:Thiamine-triphosphatase n=1 Tax=Chrysemys picta bellii TaxID=8478 RepID=A0A8C3IQQ9_CHRPI
MPSGSIEVESKFEAGPDTEARLAALGAAPAGSSSFRDLYYDTPDLRLTRADHWLRLRQGAGWELKCPPVLVPPPAMATTYQELTSPRAIVGRLCGVLGVAPVPGWDQVPGAVAGLGLQEFASFVTQRRSYRLGGLRVDLDQADFGYAVAEVEALVGAQEDVPVALEEVLQLRRALGRDGATRVPGKMSIYLQRHRPRHYQELLLAGVLRPLVAEPQQHSAPLVTGPGTGPSSTEPP